MSQSSKEEIKTWVINSQKGDKHAFGELVRHFSRRIFYVTFHVTRNRTDAEDLTQETFLRAFRGLKTFDFKCDFFTWLYRIAINVSLNHLRRNRRQPSLNDDSMPRKLERQASEGKDPREIAEIRQLFERVLKGIDELGPELKMTLVLFGLHGLSHREVAEILECPEGTVAWRISEARQQLKRSLRRYLRGDGTGKRDGVQGSETETLRGP